MTAPEPLRLEHPDLIDDEGVRWRWGTDGDREGYVCGELFCAYDRADIERTFGPVVEVVA